MDANQKTLPVWILIVSGFFALMEIFAAFALCLSPESITEKVDLGASGVLYLIYMWAARQFALGVILAYSTYKKSVPMLTISYIFLLVMFIGDAIIGTLEKENSMIIASVLMCVISSGMLYVLDKGGRRSEVGSRK
ncbi:hypothetical protein [Daejeonella lutea]|uniref:Uncharacterized protein n=1 Tax=Daejeonella lutea TaxID=572036 RepID=A0A1T5BLC9_9SPHI|nr:hypothetical protein [Daejeonella lutea]SKB48082.1 hypothetical protein SAMN05661099_1607 [Daejeonella lutea]